MLWGLFGLAHSFASDCKPFLSRPLFALAAFEIYFGLRARRASVPGQCVLNPNLYPTLCESAQQSLTRPAVSYECQLLLFCLVSIQGSRVLAYLLFGASAIWALALRWSEGFSLRFCLNPCRMNFSIPKFAAVTCKKDVF